MNVEIAQRLSARRKQAGLSQEALAEQLGVSRQAVSKWERSESSPDTDNLIALAELYGVSLDELLYVEDEMRDDVKFEAADRAAEHTAGGLGASSQPPVPPTPDANASTSTAGVENSTPKQKVRVGFDGVHVLDGDDYVHVTWRDGVHVKDSKNGEEVHVGWSGIHVKDGSAKSGQAEQPEPSRAEKSDEWFGVTSDGVGGRDDEDNEFVMNSDGVVVNGEHYDSWQDAHAHYHHEEGFWRDDPCGYTVKGERFETLDDAKAKYGSEVGKSIPVRKHYLREFEKTWVKFPYPLVVIVVYLLLGILNGAWAMGLFLFLTIPLYYMVGHAIGRRRISPLISGAYPIVVTGWFCWMAFVENAPHPAWVAFLTIPLVEWLVHSLSRWWRERKQRRVAAENAPIDVEVK